MRFILVWESFYSNQTKEKGSLDRELLSKRNSHVFHRIKDWKPQFSGEPHLRLDESFRLKHLVEKEFDA